MALSALLFSLYFGTCGGAGPEYWNGPIPFPSVRSPAMHIQRTPPPLLQPLATPAGPADAELTAQQPGAGSTQADPPAVPGVRYTASSSATTKDDAQLPDLNSLSVEDQLKLGQRMGVFTKITYSKEGRMVANPFASGAAPGSSSSADPYAGIAAPGFLSGAVSAMRDFEEGMAVLKAHAPATETKGAKGADFWSGSLKSLQNAAAKLNVFA